MVRPTRFEIKHERTDAMMTVSVAGELDLRTTEILWEHIEKSLDGDITELTLDLRDLDFIDSTGLRLLIRLNDRSQDEAWRLRLRSPEREAATLVLRITGMDTALPFIQSDER